MDAELKRICAKIAYQSTCATILKQYTDIIDKAFLKIHEAIGEGLTAITFDCRNFRCSLTQDEIDKLRWTKHYFESLDYNFKITTNSAGCYCISISWDQKKDYKC